MVGVEQCKQCGAVLLPEDTFCGECRAPRTEATSPSPRDAQPEALPPASEDAAPAATGPVPSTRTGWRAAFVALTVVGVLVFILGILAFLLAGVTETEGWTAQENWLFSAGCCLLPIAGSGLVLILAGAGIWFKRLRES
jgi:hypothetical protein